MHTSTRRKITNTGHDASTQTVHGCLILPSTPTPEKSNNGGHAQNKSETELTRLEGHTITLPDQSPTTNNSSFAYAYTKTSPRFCSQLKATMPFAHPERTSPAAEDPLAPFPRPSPSPASCHPARPFHGAPARRDPYLAFAAECRTESARASNQRGGLSQWWWKISVSLSLSLLTCVFFFLVASIFWVSLLRGSTATLGLRRDYVLPSFSFM